MRNPFPITHWLLGWELSRLRRMIARLRRREGSLSFHAEQGGPYAKEAALLAADVGCILTDHLDLAADALKRAVLGCEPLPGFDGLPGVAASEGEAER